MALTILETIEAARLLGLTADDPRVAEALDRAMHHDGYRHGNDIPGLCTACDETAGRCADRARRGWGRCCRYCSHGPIS